MMERKTIRVSKKKLFWAIIILIIIWAVWWINRPRYLMDSMVGGFGGAESVQTTDVSMMEKAGAPVRDIAMMPPDYYPRPYDGTPDITDTRQFLKINYSAEIKTRDVKTMARDVRNLVRDAEGRIDNQNESEKYAYISFVIPKSQFEAFRDEVGSLTYTKLITTNVSSENRLGQKQNIEEQMQNATSTLADLEKQKTSLITRHNQTISSFNTELANVRSQLSTLRLNLEGTLNEIERSNLQNQIVSLTQRENSLIQNIASENNSYNSLVTNINNRIASAKKWVENVEKQDKDFGNDIETVNGHINISWVSYWQVAKIYSPIHPGWIVLVLAIIAWKVLGRFGYVPKIELV